MSPGFSALICIEIKGGLLFGIGLDVFRDIMEFLEEVSDAICYVYTVKTEKLAVSEGG